MAFLISDFLFELTSESVRSASAKHDLCAVQVSDPAEIDLPAAGMMRFIDPESGDHVEVNTSNQAVRQFYRKEREAWQETVEAFFRKHRVDLIRLRTDEDYIPELRNFFRSRDRMN